MTTHADSGGIAGVFLLAAAAIGLVAIGQDALLHYGPTWRDYLLRADPTDVIVVAIVLCGLIVLGCLGMELIEAEKDRK